MVKVSPPWLVASLYLLCSAASLAMVAGMLLQQQLLFVLTGISAVDALKMQKGTAGARPSRRRTVGERIGRIFGDTRAWTWLMPVWNAHLPRRSCKKGC